MHKLSILVVALALLLTPAFAQTQIHSAGQSTPLGVWTIGANPGNRYARYSRAGRVAPPTAIAPIASHQANVWPTTMSHVLHIDMPTRQSLRQATLYSLGGIATGVELKEGMMNVEALPAGLYVLRLDFHGGKSEHYKLIKK